MSKKIKIKHLSMMKNTKEFFLLKVPKELNILFYVTVSFFVACICVICFGKFDEVIKVHGIVRTKDNVSIVKNILEGQITDIYFKPGQKVQKDDILYKLDASIYDAQKNILDSKIEDLQKKLEGTSLLISSFEADKNLIPKENKVYFNQFENFINQKNELTAQSKLAYSLYQEELNNHSAVKNQKNIKQRKIEYEVVQNELESYKSSFSSHIYSEEMELKNQLNELQQELDAFLVKYEFLSLKAPVSGYVQEISSLNAGDFLQADSNVLNIIPDNQQSYRVEMQVTPKDMGKLREGMDVKYRLTAFPYFEYKGANGKITAIDPDIRSSDSAGLYYVVYADIDRTIFSNNKGESFPIKAGLETDARIVIQKTRILTYIFRKLDFIY